MSERQRELGALARLGFSEAGRLAGGVGELHGAIAARAYEAAGTSHSPARVLHDAISGAVHAGVASAAELAGRGAGRALEHSGEGGPAPSSSARGALAIAIVTGLIGDQLEREQSPLAAPMAVRVNGEPLAPEAFGQAFPDPGRRLVVFLHGLFETEFAWGTEDSYGARLERELGWTPVQVRYNSGRHIWENGRSLSELMETLVERWPVPVEELALVGHSMGGLVARSAGHAGSEGGSHWAGLVTHVVSLGSPHDGAPLARAVDSAAAALDVLPESRPLGAFLRRRSSGIRDLRLGSLVDEDWRDREPGALRGAARREVPLLEGATHHFVSASVTRDARHPLGRVVGDWLVLEPSARPERLRLDPGDCLHVGGTHHLALLSHPAVYERLRDWLA